nr:adhesive plaque matrix protein [Megalopta genalis]
MMRILISLVLANLSVVASVLPEVTSYAKVSRNGQQQTDLGNDRTPWITRIITGGNETENEGRSVKHITITASPVYVAPKGPKLHKGEAVDYSSGSRYSTLDYEMLAKLNARKQLQDRYHPSPIYAFKNKEPSSGGKESPRPVESGRPIGPANGPPSGPPSGPASSNGFDFTKQQPFADAYDYKPSEDFLNDKPAIPKPSGYLGDKPAPRPAADYLADKPVSMPLSVADYSDYEISDKPADSYKPDSYKPDSYKPDSHKPDSYKPDSYKPDSYKPDSYKPDSYKPDSYKPDPFGSHDDPDYPDFPAGSSYPSDPPPKPIEYSAPLDHPPYDGHSYDHDHDHDHDFHHELIYDHIPEYHHEHTEKPEMNDQRLDKRPYSYYFIGKKLWYVPLYFSIYFIIYIAALVLKSIARHKIAFPAHLAEAVEHGRTYADVSWWDLAGRALEGVESFAEKFGKGS